jgi:hypothetical protein
MFHITRQKALNDIKYALKNAEKHKISSFKWCLQDLELFANLSYKYNFNYTSDEAEMIIQHLSQQYFKPIEVESKKNRIVFYDSFAIDNRGLTQQYLRAIFSKNAELLFITPQSIGKDILNELSNYSKAKIVQYNKYKVNDLKIVLEEIQAFCPEKVLLHFSPWDISGMCLWNNVYNVERYLINLTDHAFWLGKSCADFILEFRSYGAYLSVNHRGILIDKLLLQPYYPIINKTVFQGFPFEKENKLIAFAGSHLYKISGRDNVFLKLINRVLQENKNVVFVLAGPGDKTSIEKFISQNALEDRFYLLGDRNDISSVIENIDIYINTFPMIGGLMSQYAAISNKPIIGFTSPDLEAYNNVEDLLLVPQKKILYKTSEEEFCSYFKLLVEDVLEREHNISHTKDAVLTPEQFSNSLFSNFYKKTGRFTDEFWLKVMFNSEPIINLYLEMENQYLHTHRIIFVEAYKVRAFLKYPFQTLKVISKKVKEKFKK